MDALIGVVLAGCIAAVSYGLVLIPRRLAVALAATRSNPVDEAALVAQARAELACTGWTPHHEALYQAEIAASKRGDLLAAAALAEARELAQ